MNEKRKTSRKKTQRVYSKGDLNLIADALIHPLAERSDVFILAGEVVHTLIEKYPALCLERFFRYSFTRLLRKARTMKDH